MSAVTVLLMGVMKRPTTGRWNVCYSLITIALNIFSIVFANSEASSLC